MDDDEKKRIRAKFDEVDANGDGSIDEDEFAKLVESLDAGLSRAEAFTAFTALDVDGSRRLEFDEFAEWWGRQAR